MTDDIVARMRRHAKVPFDKIERKAAFDQAKRLVKDRNADIVDRLRAIVVVSGGVTNANVDHIVKAADEIELLRAERDEARRFICDLSWEDSREVAKQLGWDCYKETK